MKRPAPLLFLCGILLLSALACSFSPLSRVTTTKESPAAAATVEVIPSEPDATLPVVISGSQDQHLMDLYTRVNPGVVSIRMLTDTGGGQGSGFVYDQDGHIITNFHVVDGATSIEVDFSSGFKVRGELVGRDLDSDLAVIKVKAPADQLVPLPLGSGEALRVGQTVVAIGNPFGLSGTMTIGIVSAKDRTLDSLRESPTGGFFTSGAVIQTDAAINPGNSGGPLLNLAGEVVGINRAIRTDSTTAQGDPANSGIGFAVNVDIVKRVVPALIEKGQYDYPYLGVSSLPEVTLDVQEAFNLPQSTGAYIIDIRPNSPAADAGLIAGRDGQTPGPGGDLIIAVDGHEVRIFGDLLTYLMTQTSPGDKVVLTILRNGQRKEVSLVLGKRP
jgi:S1-C subfamily serine protease